MPLKILMIEDDIEVRRLVGRSARRRAWEFHEAGTAAEGLTRARESKPDIILLDIQLPDGEGWDVCASLKRDALLARIPIVMVSGRRMLPEDKARGIAAGADDYLAKPFDPSELWLRIEAILKAKNA